MEFVEKWKQLQSSLQPGASVSNWTADKGYLGDAFTITAISIDHVAVDSPGAQNTQLIPKKDFKVVHDLWSAYCQGSVQRHKIRDQTRFSKYIISILHHLERRFK